MQGGPILSLEVLFMLNFKSISETLATLGAMAALTACGSAKTPVNSTEVPGEPEKTSTSQTSESGDAVASDGGAGTPASAAAPVEAAPPPPVASAPASASAKTSATPASAPAPALKKQPAAGGAKPAGSGKAVKKGTGTDAKCGEGSCA